MAEENQCLAETCQGISSLDKLEEEVTKFKEQNGKILTFTSNKITFLEAGCPSIFEGFSTLQYLYINNNEIEKINAGNFSGLENLRYLELNNNGIQYLEDGAFLYLKGLYSLQITNNKIAEITDGVFEELKNLGQLILRNNGVKTIGKNAFKELTNLFSLELDNNELESGEYFENCKSLRHLVLSNNRIGFLDGNTFKNLRELIYLDLSHNKIVKLPKDLLAELTIRGQGLNLSNNLINEIEVGALNGLKIPSGVLDLSNNKIETLNNGIFENCVFDALRLDNNNIENLHFETFKGLVINKELNLTNNKITTYKGAFQNLNKIGILYLNKNRISELPDNGFEGLESLYSLILTENSIDRLEVDCFKYLNKLYSLCLGNNKIEKFNLDYVKDMRLLSSLNLGSNSILNLEPETLNHNPYLGMLHLMNNKLTDLPPNGLYKNLIDLFHLDYSWNKITTIPYRAFVAENTEKEYGGLFLQNNQISRIEKRAFEGITRASNIILCDNKIRDLEDGAFEGIGPLKHVDLSNNLIESLEVLKKLSCCSLVRLDGNKVEREDLCPELDKLELNQLDYISFESYSYKRVENNWVFVDSTVKENEYKATEGSKITTSEIILLDSLRSNINYTIQVLAYTSAGNGVGSNPIQRQIRKNNAGFAGNGKIEDFDCKFKYELLVTASTRAVPGPPSKRVTIAPSSQVPGKIALFDDKLIAIHNCYVLLLMFHNLKSNGKLMEMSLPLLIISNSNLRTHDCFIMSQVLALENILAMLKICLEFEVVVESSPRSPYVFGFFVRLIQRCRSSSEITDGENSTVNQETDIFNSAFNA
ncbi:hypothetical protein ILUMI_13157 [Ignelater luminosus]|uniref:Uncharacterized protein n=1 Tax=Ignelater luminosus TaxID=2038154 RepID=A0A8K0CZ27_IGNLU|nr:hypothetical protein ILUMI_13157 [Ignelater luminosus]